MSEQDLANGRPIPAPSSPLDAIGRGFASPKLGAMLTIAAAIALGAGLIVWTLQPEYVPVGENLNRTDSLEIVEALGSAGVDYRIDPGTGLVLVPRRDLARVQLDLAATGLGDRPGVGIELLREDQALGTSHFTETARYQHALETELARTISSLRNVESARVHLALPKQSVFVRERGTASASVTIKARTGRTIEDEQVDAVVNLVAASIPYLETSQVAVVDQWGRLLSSSEESVDGATREHYEYARRLERLYSERIEAVLAPMIGAERVRAIVTAEVDFSLSERTEEAFEPDPDQLRSEQTERTISDDAAAIGVPGALTNQPPEEGFIAEEAAADEAGTLLDRSSSTIRNFELDKTITHVRQSPGGVLRVSAAVVVDDRTSTDAEGNVVRTPIGEEELAQYTALAREAIGFSEARGDSVTVFNRAFQPPEELPEVEPLPLWEKDWFWTMVRQSLIGLAVLALVLMVLRPAVKRLDPPRAAGSLARLDSSDEESDEERDRMKALGHGDGEKGKGGTAALPSSIGRGGAALDNPPVVYGDILNMARAMAAEDPRRVAKVVKDWVGES